MFIESLISISIGSVQTFFCSDINLVLYQLDHLAQLESRKLKVSTRIWETLPPHSKLLDDILHSMATAAQSVWPEWYGQRIAPDSYETDSLESELITAQKIQHLQASRQAICVPWLKVATAACRLGNLPIFNDGYYTEIQFTQLALALESNELVVLLILCDQNPTNANLLSLSRSAAWCAQKTHSRVAVFLWEGLADREELGSINYRSVTLPSSDRELHKNGDEDEGAKATIWPIRGKPHPLSPGEQAMFNKLLQDKELKDLFSFNQDVSSKRGRRYLVDLLWVEGQVVVEIDGYKYHGNQFAFIEDRNRDYELLISGYLVLRLSHEEVIHDLEIALEKIRDVVHFRRNQQLSIMEKKP